MKNLNLGRILLPLLLPILIMAGSVSAKLDRTIIYKGDTATLTLSANGKEVEFPDLTEIGSFPVLGTSTQQSINMINGEVTRSLSKSYQFAPTQSMVIPAYTIKVDGEAKQTQPLTIKVTKPSPASKNSPVQLEMTADKTTAYVGEPIRLNLTFKSLPNAHYDKIELSEPDLKKFWVKKLPNLQQGSEGDYHTQTYTYVLFPQQEGNYTIPAPFAQLGTYAKGQRGGSIFDDPFFGSIGRRLQWQKLYANELHLNIKPLPNGLDIYGNFEIHAKVDKTEVKANKPVNLTLEIKGQGNLEDIKKFELDIPNAVVYSDEPKITNSGPTKGFFTQKIAIVADRDFTIPAIEFRYFDKKTQRPKTIATQPIAIKVTGTPAQPSSANKIEQTAPVQPIAQSQTVTAKPIVAPSHAPVDKLLWYLLGLISGIVLSVLAWIGKTKFNQHTQKETPLRQKLKRAKSDKALFELLLPYKNEDPDLKKIVEQLEANLYHGGNHTIDRDLVMEIMEEMA